MRASLRTCSWRSAVAVLASGVVISASALSGGVAPAFAKPGDRSDPGIPIIPTPVVIVPDASQVAPEEQAPQELPRKPREQPAPPQVEAPPAPAAAPVIQAPAPQPEPAAPQPESPAPQIQAPAPPKKEAPKVVEGPKVVEAPKVEAPQADAPKANAPRRDAPKADVLPADTPSVDTPRADAPEVGAPAPLPDVDQPAEPGDPKQDAQVPRNLVGGQAPEADGSGRADNEVQTDPSTASKAAQQVALATPDTLQAPEQDIALARQSKPIEVKPESASKQDIDSLASAINLQGRTRLGPFDSEFGSGSEFSVGGDRERDRGRDWDDKYWDNKVRQWDRDWIDYDEFYRPIIFNPFRAPVRIVYALANTTRMLVIQPLARVVVDVAELAAYSFTAVVLGAANVVSDLAYVAADVVNVAVGTFFGGGYIPRAGAPFVAPPPLLSYDNVPVQVRYSNATYDPFRVNQIVDLGDDVQYGGRKVLLDGATPAWGQWTTSPTGERQFEVHRTQQYPGLGEPQEAPLPGDYRMQLASDESAGVDSTQVFLTAAAGVVAGLGLGALGLALHLGRRRRVA